MENNVQIFDFDENPVRVIEKDGEPWFVAADVCRVLDIQNPSDAIKCLDDDERARYCLGRSANGGGGETNIINESGLYNLIFRSRKPEAKRFRKWVTAEVLPSIRKTGRYEMPSVEARDETDVLPDRSMSQWLKMIRETRLLYGRAAAREMWKRSPLPVINENEETAGDVGERRGRECLDILLSRTFDGDPVSAYISARDEQALIRCGLKLVSEYDGDFLAIANFHPFLEKVYHKTPFSNGRHIQALRCIRGARSTNAFRFGKFRSRCTIVPAAFVEGEKDR
uniref:Repressor domain protein n=1 Tax=Siphoviridae sp. ctFgp7 TaxID=2827821 RepID=A0A8S5STI8_9CAUD|nr:MAG TPA: repressor domain protein [Siphoviridae sp. ctFgp7]